MNKPIFSVVIPTYNSSKTITKTINSVLKQNYQNFEIILVDDGSTDNTVNKVELINDNRIRIFKIKRSGGPAKPRNYGIKKSKSNWICFLDSDDLWEYNKLKILFKSIKNNDFDILCHNEYIFKLNKIKPRIHTNNMKYYYLYLSSLICVFITLFPFIPNGSFFNNWVNVIYYFPLGLLMYSNHQLNKNKNLTL